MDKLWDVIIIGSGPAGLTAAIYTARGAVSTLIFGGEAWGGQLMLTTMVDNFPGFPKGILGPELVLNMRQQAERFGAEFLQKNVQAVNLRKKPFEITADGQQYFAKALIVAAGASTVWLGVPGEKELIGRGVSSCAPCDAPFFKNKKVAVVGGGDSACEEALTLAKYTSSVVIFHRRDELRASKIMQEKVFKSPDIKVVWNSEIQEVKGKEKLESLVVKNNKSGEISTQKFDGLFVAIGHKPESDLFKGQIDLDERGFVKVTARHGKTSVEGVFVAGDVFDPHYKQAVTAAGSGCAAALETLGYLTSFGDKSQG